MFRVTIEHTSSEIEEVHRVAEPWFVPARRGFMGRDRGQEDITRVSLTG